MKDIRELENLSAYLDGQLDPKESTMLESRLKSDPELASALQDLRSARGILRKLPARKAPRNFTLTRQMVGLNPPLPRSYPLIRFATVFASILFLLSFTATALSPLVSLGGAAAPMPVGGMGGGGGCEGCEGSQIEQSAASEAPAATEEPPAADLAPPFSATESLDALPTESARVVEPTPSLKESGQEASVPTAADEITNQPEPELEQKPSSIVWPMLFLGIAILGMLSLWIIKFTARIKWR